MKGPGGIAGGGGGNSPKISFPASFKKICQEAKYLPFATGDAAHEFREKCPTTMEVSC